MLDYQTVFEKRIPHCLLGEERRPKSNEWRKLSLTRNAGLNVICLCDCRNEAEPTGDMALFGLES